VTKGQPFCFHCFIWFKK